MAPPARLSAGKATTRAGSNSSRWPLPRQAGQAPHRGGRGGGRESTRRGGVELLGLADAVAGRAGAQRGVEGKQARLQFGQRVVAQGAGELGAEQMLPARI